VHESEQCRALYGPVRCSLPAGHSGPEHLTGVAGGDVLARWDVEPDAPAHSTCIETTSLPGRPQDRTYVCGPECPTTPQRLVAVGQGVGRTAAEALAADRARAARRRVYAENLRRAASRALDRYIAAMVSDDPGTPVPDGGTVIESIGDYVIQRMTDEGAADSWFCGNRVEHLAHPWSDYGVQKTCGGVRPLQHNHHYGVPGCSVAETFEEARGADGRSDWWCDAHQGWHRTIKPSSLCGPRVTDESAVHVSHLHEDDGSPCHKIECHGLDSGEYCTWCGGQRCRVVLADPCAGGLCSDPAAHAEGGHDV
jgi:hypothetical protein